MDLEGRMRHRTDRPIDPMAKNESAGLLLYRRRNGALEVLLVHPGGPYWRRKDAGAWTIPKGGLDPGEGPETAARREFLEETGHAAEGACVPLTPVRQAGGKLVHAFACEGDLDCATLSSNLFSMEWPPRSGTMESFPEVDRAEWMTLERGRTMILAGQRPLLDELERRFATV